MFVKVNEFIPPKQYQKEKRSIKEKHDKICILYKYMYIYILFNLSTYSLYTNVI